MFSNSHSKNTNKTVLAVSNIIVKTVSRGECFALKSGDNYELRDYKCSREIGFICTWTSKSDGFQMLSGTVSLFTTGKPTEILPEPKLSYRLTILK